VRPPRSSTSIGLLAFGRVILCSETISEGIELTV
jgi:hypothetical protein